MSSSEPEDSALETAEEASLRRVMSRLRARLTPGLTSGGARPEVAAERNPSRQHAAVCGEIVID